MVVYAPDGSGKLVATQVATSSASEFLDLESPLAGTYYIVANLYSTPDNGAASAAVQAVSFSGDAGNLTVNPNPIVAPNGTATTATANWSRPGRGLLPRPAEPGRQRHQDVGQRQGGHGCGAGTGRSSGSRAC